MRFYLVDRIKEACPGKYVEGLKCISMSDDIFNEHFPGFPVFPGSLILEGLAQMSGLFFEYCLQQQGITGKRAVLTLVNRMKYRKIVIPGDCLNYRADVTVFYPNEYATVSVLATCEGKKCAEGELFFSFLDVMDEEMKKTNDRLMALAFRNARIISAE
ncbi:MAG: beta-hydroxyacyl-ACP dehydratase [Mangrovibacterium sp.]|jgi:3-hydroxyacyl-[acyl-carrier-protein] dehydratase|nr:beta-hydroxyacyl-ACP dehydratase [Mangrovibacterium sp.]